MRLGEPQFLLLLLLIPALGAVCWSAYRVRQRRLAAFVDPVLALRLTPSVSRGRRIAKDVLLLTAVALMGLAATRPQWGFRWERFERQGIELVVVLDTSLSMRARDAFPSRLDRAKLELRELLQALEGDQIALVAFAGVSFVQCPMTVDYRAAELFLRGVTTDLLPVPGTAIGAGIRQALGLFAPGREGGQAILLITDGEDQGSDPLGAASLAKELGVVIFTIGVGSEVPVTIPVDDEGTLKKDGDGKLVFSSLDEATLSEMAQMTGGAYIRSTTGDLNVASLLEQVRAKTTPRDVLGSRVQRWEDRYQALAFLAFLVLIVEALLDERRGATLRLAVAGRREAAEED